jgi:hypothetical protein
METKGDDFTIADIAPDSNVILVIGAGMKRLKAYLLVLKSALRVFSAILGPRFSEG